MTNHEIKNVSCLRYFIYERSCRVHLKSAARIHRQKEMWRVQRMQMIWPNYDVNFYYHYSCCYEPLTLIKTAFESGLAHTSL